MSLALYRDTKLSSRNQAHLGFYDTRIYGISHATVFHAFHGTSCVVSGKCFYILAEHSFPSACQSVVNRVSLRLNFSQFPREAIGE